MPTPEQPNAKVRTIVTGLGWMGAGTGSVDTAIEELVAGASRELIVLAYSMTDGANHLLKLTRTRLMTGLIATSVVNPDRLYGSARQSLLALARDYPDTFYLYYFEGGEETDFLHAKALIADRQRAIIGSANLSWNGLVANHELCVQIEGQVP